MKSISILTNGHLIKRIDFEFMVAIKHKLVLL